MRPTVQCTFKGQGTNVFANGGISTLTMPYTRTLGEGEWIEDVALGYAPIFQFTARLCGFTDDFRITQIDMNHVNLATTAA